LVLLRQWVEELGLDQVEELLLLVSLQVCSVRALVRHLQEWLERLWGRHLQEWLELVLVLHQLGFVESRELLWL
jgi:hypothetical protein